MTNYEKIKAMTVEEMVLFCDSCSCNRCIYYRKHEEPLCNVAYCDCKKRN